jgi:GH43 family beta-xylosidase
MMNPTYLNPVYKRNFPDPFVLKVSGEYWAYCSGFWADGRAFGILHSPDLVQWQEVGGAMAPLPGGWPCYWAPEMMVDNGRFYLYYSVGDEEQMHIRVATADHPGGPFTDSGHRLTNEPFAIDAHVFTDDDGRRYLFYATDFLSHSHIGTGTVRDRLRDPFTLAGQPQPVTRARYTWQIYDPQREAKGGVCWHTVEGPFVLRRKGIYYQMFSGGNWQNPSYGVGYATTGDLQTADEWAQFCDGEHTLPVLRTVPEQVIGPGHNSVVRGPDNRQLFCVYHRWNKGGDGRLLAIDRLDWIGDRLHVLGPSYTPQPAPLPPTFQDRFDRDASDGLSGDWACRSGEWAGYDGAAQQQAREGTAEALCPITATHFLAEISLRSTQRGQTTPTAAYGIILQSEQGVVLRCALQPSRRQALIGWQDGPTWREQALSWPDGFDPHLYHLLRLDVNGRYAAIELDDTLLRWSGWLGDEEENGRYQLALFTKDTPAAFGHVTLTAGWQDEFDDATSPADWGWHNIERDGRWVIQQRQLRQLKPLTHATVIKGPLPNDYELVVNVRLEEEGGSELPYGFYPALHENGRGPLIALRRAPDNAGWELLWRAETGDEARFPLPEAFDPFVYQQFRFWKVGEWLSCAWVGLAERPLAEGPVPHHPTHVGLYAAAAASWDMVRVTAVMS